MKDRIVELVFKQTYPKLNVKERTKLVASFINLILSELPEAKVINKNKFTVDELRYPTGWNAHRAWVKKRLEGK